MATKYQYITERFSGLNDFCNAMNQRPMIKGASKASIQTGKDRLEFTETHDYEEAEHIARTGDRKHADMIKEAKFQTRKKGGQWEQRNVPKVVRSVVGQRPCVPATLTGHPLNMYKRVVTKVDTPVLNLYYSYAPSCGVSTEEAVSVGTKVTEAIRSIERSGIRVNLYAGMILEAGNQRISVFTKIKDSSKDMDIVRMAYPLIHPSYFRRHMFRWVETREELDRNLWNGGYGRVITDTGKTQSEFVEQMNKDGWNVGAFLSFYSERHANVEQIVEHVLQQNRQRQRGVK